MSDIFHIRDAEEFKSKLRDYILSNNDICVRIGSSGKLQRLLIGDIESEVSKAFTRQLLCIEKAVFRLYIESEEFGPLPVAELHGYCFPNQ